MRTYSVFLESDSCIGTHACNAESPQFFVPADDGKVNLFDSFYNVERNCWEATVESADIEEVLRAAEACPVKAIQVARLLEPVEQI